MRRINARKVGLGFAVAAILTAGLYYRWQHGVPAFNFLTPPADTRGTARPEKEETPFSPVLSQTLKVSLDGPKTAVKTTDKVDLDLTLTNMSAQTIRVLNSGCSATGWDAVELQILRENDLPVDRVSHMAGILFSFPGQEQIEFQNHTTEIPRGATIHFRCPLVTSPLPDFSVWSFSYRGKSWPARFDYSPQLRPGHYRIIARYVVDKTKIQRVLHANHDTPKIFDSLWQGECDSTPFELTVRP